MNWVDDTHASTAHYHDAVVLRVSQIPLSSFWGWDIYQGERSVDAGQSSSRKQAKKDVVTALVGRHGLNPDGSRKEDA